jgi:hypothetical protein
MHIRMNNSMQKILDDLSISFDQISDKKLPDELEGFLKNGVVATDGGYFLWAPSEAEIARHKGDTTYLEYSETHVHFDWHYTESVEHATVVRDAIVYLKRLAGLLNERFPLLAFTILLSTDLDKPNYCVVRFWRERSDEKPLLLDSELEDFAQEGILLARVGPSSQSSVS